MSDGDGAGSSGVVTALERIQGMLEAVTYKPAWEFKAYADLCSSEIRVIAKFTAEDVERRGTATLIEARFPVPDPLSISSPFFERWLLDCVIHLETHEAQEWFRASGQHVVDPHPELRR